MFGLLTRQVPSSEEHSKMQRQSLKLASPKAHPWILHAITSATFCWSKGQPRFKGEEHSSFSGKSGKEFVAIFILPKYCGVCRFDFAE